MPYEAELTIFVVPKDKPAGPIKPAEPVTISAPTRDGLFVAAERALAAVGCPKYRSISFTPKGMIAYVEETP